MFRPHFCVQGLVYYLAAGSSAPVGGSRSALATRPFSEPSQKRILPAPAATRARIAHEHLPCCDKPMDLQANSADNARCTRVLEDVEKCYGNRWYRKDGRRLSRSSYIFPIDEEELDRLDLFHKFFLTARGDVLFSSPIDTATDLRILDLGAGTGIWSIDMAKALPRAHVHAVDMNMIQPAMIPVNMEPPVEMDIESDWTSLGRNWHMIHARTLFGSVSSWVSLYKRIYEHLIPDTGYLEQVEIDWVPRFEHIIPHDSALVDWTDKLLSAMDRHGRSMRVEPKRTRKQLKAAGFKHIDESSMKVCFSPWSDDRRERRAALWFRAAFVHGIRALSYGPMMTYLGMSTREIDLLCETVLEELHSSRYKAYCRM